MQELQESHDHKSNPFKEQLMVVGGLFSVNYVATTFLANLIPSVELQTGHAGQIGSFCGLVCSLVDLYKFTSWQHENSDSVQIKLFAWCCQFVNGSFMHIQLCF